MTATTRPAGSRRWEIAQGVTTTRLAGSRRWEIAQGAIVPAVEASA